jgi:hypothetical protein
MLEVETLHLNVLVLKNMMVHHGQQVVLNYSKKRFAGAGTQDASLLAGCWYNPLILQKLVQKNMMVHLGQQEVL